MRKRLLSVYIDTQHGIVSLDIRANRYPQDFVFLIVEIKFIASTMIITLQDNKIAQQLALLQIQEVESVSKHCHFFH